MKHIYILTAVAILFTGSSCKKDFLDIVPKGSAIAQTTADYDAILNNFTAGTFLSPVTGAAMDVQIPMGDELAGCDPELTGRKTKYQRAFSWAGDIYDANVNADELGMLNKMYVYNKVINEVMNAKDGSATLKLQLQSEARAIRAFYYFYLIQWYAKPYLASTASTDPGFPIVTTADVTVNSYTRASVQDVYNFILADLVAAIPNLPLDQGNRLRMTRAAAEMLLGKVNAFMGNYNTALPYLDASLKDLPGPTTVAHVSLYDYSVVLALNGPWGYTTNSARTFVGGAPNAWYSNENLFSAYFFNYWTLSYNDLVITKNTVSLYGSSDLRLRLYTTLKYGGSAYGASINGIMRRNGLFTNPNGLTLPELYLLRAECRARTGDLNGAKSDLLVFRTSRMPASDAVVTITDQTALIKFIIDERLREFAVQGYRWFDMRRLSVDPIFSANTYTHTWYNADGSVKSTYTLTSNRLTLRFPQKTMDENPGMINNP